MYKPVPQFKSVVVIGHCLISRSSIYVTPKYLDKTCGPINCNEDPKGTKLFLQSRQNQTGCDSIVFLYKQDKSGDVQGSW